MNSIDEKFAKAIELRNDGLFLEAKNVLQNIIELYVDHPKISTVHTVLGGIFSDLEKHNDAQVHFKLATRLQPDLELSSMGLYLSLVKLEQYDRAIEELNRYLSNYPAKSYITTLKELIGDLKNGYARDHESVIIRLCKKHNVSIFDDQ